MTELVAVLAAVVPALPLACAVALLATRTPAQADRLNIVAAVATAATALALAAVGARARRRRAAARRAATSLDGASGVFLALIAVVGLCSALDVARLPAHGRAQLVQRRALARTATTPRCTPSGPRCSRVPIAGNLAVAWLLVEATTAASALLVAFTGAPPRARGRAGSTSCSRRSGCRSRCWASSCSRSALAGDGEHGLQRAGLARAAEQRGRAAAGGALVAFVLILAGLATKIGWAPVHNWLPDAHSEAPAPISALLSAALLPTVAARGLAREDDARRRRRRRDGAARCSSASGWPR